MKFGSVTDPSTIDLRLPDDHPDTARVLNAHQNQKPFEVYVGCGKWNKKDLKGFYPPGTKDELIYYASRFNAIELNATFYRAPSAQQVAAWASKTPDGFKFFPKIPSQISHIKRLHDIRQPLLYFCDAVYGFEDKLGMVFLQMHNNFLPKDFERVVEFVKSFPEDIPLALELRNNHWVKDEPVFDEFSRLLKQHHRTHVIVDTAGRRDLLHMRLTSDAAFIRYVGANHKSDYTRLDDWVERIINWRAQGLNKLYFFVHQNIEKDSPLLSAYFINKLNEACQLTLKDPMAD